MENLAWTLAGLFFIAMMVYRYYYIFHKRMHKYFKGDSKKNFDDFMKVVKHNNELQNKIWEFEIKENADNQSDEKKV